MNCFVITFLTHWFSRQENAEKITAKEDQINRPSTSNYSSIRLIYIIFFSFDFFLDADEELEEEENVKERCLGIVKVKCFLFFKNNNSSLLVSLEKQQT